MIKMDNCKAKLLGPIGLQGLELTNYMSVSIIYCYITNYPNTQGLKPPPLHCIPFGLGIQAGLSKQVSHMWLHSAGD